MHVRSFLLSVCTVVAPLGTLHAAPQPPASIYVVLNSSGESALGRGAKFTNEGEVALVVSQKDKMFDPAEAELRVGQAIEIVNDDTTVHNVFCQSPDFKYNSGPQQPGTRSRVTFTAAGRFEIRCAIHPKMKLNVTVNP